MSFEFFIYLHKERSDILKCGRFSRGSDKSTVFLYNYEDLVLVFISVSFYFKL